jgi:glycerol-3-phosphate acyltransferase PlsY
MTPALLSSIIAGYVLGALPLADRLSRRHGIDIFSTGTGLAGASNVLRSIGKVPALLVIIGDMAKGALIVPVTSLLGVESPWVLLPVAAVLVGHSWSVFSGFRGGDGLAALGGAILTLFGTLGLVTVAVAMLVALGGQRMPYTSLLSIVFGYAALVVLSVAYNGDTTLALGTGGVAGLVLAHALLGHRRRRHDATWSGLGDPEPQPDSRGSTTNL